MTTPLRFVSVGFGNAVCANKIHAVLIPGAAPAKRRLKNARETNTFIDMTFGRSLKCLQLLEDGSLVGCGITAKTILTRLNGMDTERDEEPGGE